MVKVAAAPTAPASFREVPELRRAYAAESEAVANVISIRHRLPLAQSNIHLRRQDRDVLTSRAAHDATVTGADLRKAEEAIQDAEALVTLLTEALPKAERAAKAAGDARNEAVRRFEQGEAAFLQAEFDVALAALQAATAARDRAHKRLTNWPPELRAELEAIHDAHGRDPQAKAEIDEMWRMEQVARSRAMNL